MTIATPPTPNYRPTALMTRVQGWWIIALLALLVLGMFLAWFMIFDFLNTMSNVGNTISDVPDNPTFPIPADSDPATCCG